MNRYIWILCLVLFTLFALDVKAAKADWAYSFVVWEGYVYVMSDEYVNEVDKEIGHVTKYSDMEDTYSGNFSNHYRKGTKYFSIPDVSTAQAIAIEEKDGTYRKATRSGKYAGGSENSDFFMSVFGIIVVCLLLGLILYQVNTKRERVR